MNSYSARLVKTRHDTRPRATLNSQLSTHDKQTRHETYPQRARHSVVTYWCTNPHTTAARPVSVNRPGPQVGDRNGVAARRRASTEQVERSCRESNAVRGARQKTHAPHVGPCAAVSGAHPLHASPVTTQRTPPTGVQLCAAAELV